MDFTGPLPMKKRNNRFMLLVVEYLTGWPIVRSTKGETGGVAVDFMQEEIIGQLGMVRVIIADNGPALIADAFNKDI